MNVLYILSDQHNPEYTGCFGRSITRTPNIDRLAKLGTSFDSTYCLSPICSPTRAAMITGRYVHEISVWDNAVAYNGVPMSFGHYFEEQGIHLTTIGKLDFEPDCKHGISETRLAKHRENIDITSLYREQEILPRYDLLSKHRATGPADSLESYASDIAVVDETLRWFEEEPSKLDQPWVLVVNLNDLHRPWNPPQEIWDYYDKKILFEELDERFIENFNNLHPSHRVFARHHLGEIMSKEETRRAVVGYHGSCEILDFHVGKVLEGLEMAGLWDDTLVVYSSDHGGTVGEHRNFDHGSMYEGSIRIPLIFCGPGIQAGIVNSNPVSALDILPTITEAVGYNVPIQMRGNSLFKVLNGEVGTKSSDFAFCEYHGAGFDSSSFMVRFGALKLIECVGYRPMLFNLLDDPYELNDLAAPDSIDSKSLGEINKLREILYSICSPEAVDFRAKADQRRRRKEMEKDNSLYEALYKRGYEMNSEKLILREEILS